MRRLLLHVLTVTTFFLTAVAMLPVFAVVALWHGRRDPGRRARGRVMRFFGRFTSSVTPVWRFSLEGAPPEDISTRPYVIVANHESTADPFLLSHLRVDARFVGKEELFRLPLLGWLLHLGGDIPLRRGAGESVRAMMEECRKTLASGLSVVLFPEGTRTRDGRLLPFKDGAFRLAIEAGVPILPVALRGTRECIPSRSLLLQEARAVAEILAPIPTAGLSLADVPRLREATRDRIAMATSEGRRIRLLAEVQRAREASEVVPATWSPETMATTAGSVAVPLEA